jgi:hypothetical protein
VNIALKLSPALAFVHDFVNAADQWDVSHLMGFIPSWSWLLEEVRALAPSFG